jgi:hypothetical protein
MCGVGGSADAEVGLERLLLCGDVRSMDGLHGSANARRCDLGLGFVMIGCARCISV